MATQYYDASLIQSSVFAYMMTTFNPIDSIDMYSKLLTYTSVQDQINELTKNGYLSFPSVM